MRRPRFQAELLGTDLGHLGRPAGLAVSLQTEGIDADRHSRMGEEGFDRIAFVAHFRLQRAGRPDPHQKTRAGQGCRCLYWDVVVHAFSLL